MCSTNEKFHTKVLCEQGGLTGGAANLYVRFLELVCPEQPLGRPLTALTSVGRVQETSAAGSASSHLWRRELFSEPCIFFLNLLLRPSCIPKGSACSYGRWIVHRRCVAFFRHSNARAAVMSCTHLTAAITAGLPAAAAAAGSTSQFCRQHLARAL